MSRNLKAGSGRLTPEERKAILDQMDDTPEGERRAFKALVALARKKSKEARKQRERVH